MTSTVFNEHIFTVRNEVAKVIFLQAVSVHVEGGAWPGIPPGPGTPHRTRCTPPKTRYTPQDQVHPTGPGAHPPKTRYTPSPRPGTPPRTRYTPQTRYNSQTRYTPTRTRYPLWPGTPLDQVHLPGTRYTPTPPGPGTPPSPRDQVHPPNDTATAADGTHPTGMHSCYELSCS